MQKRPPDGCGKIATILPPRGPVRVCGRMAGAKRPQGAAAPGGCARCRVAILRSSYMDYCCSTCVACRPPLATPAGHH
eukprot:scaffold2298_cov388-Prasinococcus_capsulatus_cf.AAC.3